MTPLGIVAIVAAVLSMLAYSRRPTKSFRVNVQFADFAPHVGRPLVRDLFALCPRGDGQSSGAT